MNKVVIGYGCTVCGLMSSRDRWMGHTAVEVLGPDSVDAMDYSGVGEIAEPAIRADLNYFWICPDCDTQVHGNQITVEHCLMEHGKVEEVEDEDYPELARYQVHMSIELDLPVDSTREDILEAVRRFVYNSVESGMPVDKLAHQILIAGLDF